MIERLRSLLAAPDEDEEIVDWVRYPADAAQMPTRDHRKGSPREKRTVTSAAPSTRRATRAQGAARLHRPPAGRSHQLITAVVLAPPSGAAPLEAVDRHRLTMRRFGPDEARDYVERYRPLDCAGGIRIEDAGIKLCERIEGADYTGIIGLPLLAVARLLRAAGLLPADVSGDDAEDDQ